jgi:tripartite-type tricarboxylate transporter receptor subunit TctC
MRLARRTLIGTALALPAQAQPAFPSRAVRLVVGYPAGGSTDVVARLTAERLSRRWGQPVIVENRPGAAGTLGADIVAKASPDGYTLLIGASGEMAVARAGMKGIPYAPADFVAIALLTEQPLLFLVNPGVPAATLADFITLSKAEPGRFNYASFGNATSNHLLMELFRAEAGITLTHVPYRGAAPAITDLLAGQVQLTMDTIPTALPHLEAARLRALALTRTSRSAAAPQVPTMAECGFPKVVGGTWASMVAPSRTPPDVLATISVAVQAIWREGLGEAVRERGLDPLGYDAPAAKAFIAAEQAKWLAIAAEAGVQPE